jgi:hypothetical protein
LRRPRAKIKPSDERSRAARRICNTRDNREVVLDNTFQLIRTGLSTVMPGHSRPLDGYDDV